MIGKNLLRVVRRTLLAVQVSFGSTVVRKQALHASHWRAKSSWLYYYCIAASWFQRTPFQTTVNYVS